MRRLASIVALFLLLSGAAPVLACVTGGLMSQQEHACCRDMHGNCGEMAKTGCCRKEIRTDEHPQIAAKSPSTAIQWILVDWITPEFALVQTVAANLLDTPTDHSPPGLITAKITVLRI